MGREDLSMGLAPANEPSILDAPAPDTFFVSEYTVSRHFGGSEEGGWWYDWYDWQKVCRTFATKLEAATFARDINAAQKVRDREERKRDRYSVIGGPDTVFFTEDQPRELQSTETPRYE